MPYPSGLHLAIVHPKISIETIHSRSILNDQVELKDMITQSGNLAGFILGLFRTDLELIKRSLEDIIIEPQRAALIPHFYEIKEACLKAGVLGFSISGAGPLLFCFMFK